MQLPAPPSPDGVVFVLSGAGLSAASGVPTFRGEGGWWRGHRAEELATPEAFVRDPDLVLRFYAMRREVVRGVRHNPGHSALARLQAAWGPERVVLVTQNVDGLVQAAARELELGVAITEMHGSLWRVRCARRADHPLVEVGEDLDPRGVCAVCGAALRPHITWFGEVPMHLPEIQRDLERAEVFLAVGTSGVVYPAAGFAAVARRAGARCVQINPDLGGGFHEGVAAGAEVVLPALVEAWCGAA